MTAMTSARMAIVRVSMRGLRAVGGTANGSCFAARTLIPALPRRRVGVPRSWCVVIRGVLEATYSPEIWPFG